MLFLDHITCKPYCATPLEKEAEKQPRRTQEHQQEDHGKEELEKLALEKF